MSDHLDPSRPSRRRARWGLAIVILLVVLAASAAAVIATRHLASGRAANVSPVNVETSPTIPLSAGLTGQGATKGTPVGAKVTAPTSRVTTAGDR